MIQARGLIKRYGPTLAVDGLTFDVTPGKVTGFLGPNGAGKSTTMRLILGLDTPTAGSVSIAGRPYQQIRRPLHEVGAMLEAAGAHPARTARAHLRALAAASAIPRRRADEVLSLAGLDAVASHRTGGFSLGMKQRLGIAAALLGDPQVLLLDEPVNGLDPQGVAWIRTLLRTLAGQGRTVLISSHLMSEMAQTADHLIVIGHGHLIADTSLDDFIDASRHGWVQVSSPARDHLARLLHDHGATTRCQPDGSLAVHGTTATAVGDLAAQHGIAVHELLTRHPSLEQAFMDQTDDPGSYHASSPPPRTSHP